MSAVRHPRREVLKLLGVSAAATFGIACDARSPRYLLDRRGQRGHPRRFVPVEVRPDRVIRSTVGLRPFRNGGVRIATERLDGKQLIHCYGHGGAGITLSWGTANHAIGLLAGIAPPAPIAVIGAGVIGLTTAILLQRLGYRPTIYAAAIWPHTTSNASAATFYPSHVIAADRVTPEFTAMLEATLYRSYHAFQRLAGAHHGIRWMDSFAIGDPTAPASTPDIETQVHLRIVGSSSHPLARGEHPFGDAPVTQGRDLVIEPMRYLRALGDEVRSNGAAVQVRRFASLREVAALDERVVFNCTGLGARELVGDPEMRAARGQLAVLPPDPGVDYCLYHGPFYYMVPREDGIILGGTFDLDDERTVADPATTERIVAAHRTVFEAMR